LDPWEKTNVFSIFFCFQYIYYTIQNQTNNSNQTNTMAKHRTMKRHKGGKRGGMWPFTSSTAVPGQPGAAPVQQQQPSWFGSSTPTNVQPQPQQQPPGQQPSLPGQQPQKKGLLGLGFMGLGGRRKSRKSKRHSKKSKK
jgi:hypothetical protein